LIHTDSEHPVPFAKVVPTTPVMIIEEDQTRAGVASVEMKKLATAEFA